MNHHHVDFSSNPASSADRSTAFVAGAGPGAAILPPPRTQNTTRLSNPIFVDPTDSGSSFDNVGMDLEEEVLISGSIESISLGAGGGRASQAASARVCCSCGSDKITHQTYPCRCLFFCKKCAMKMATGGIAQKQRKKNALILIFYLIFILLDFYLLQKANVGNATRSLPR